MHLFLVDDEPLAIESIKISLQKHPDVEITGIATDPHQALKTIPNTPVDVLFLDIQMPEMDGFELLQKLTPHSMRVVFITAYDDYAVRAFEAEAVDYLLKPVSDERLARCLDKLRQKMQSTEGREPDVGRIFIKENNNWMVVPVNNIQYVEAQGDYVCFVTENGKYLRHGTLSSLEDELQSQAFQRVHRSYIINMDYLEKIEQSRLAVLKSGEKIPVSRSGLARLVKG